MLRMIGPEETAKASIMAIAGFKKYGMPSLIPGMDAGGILSADDMLLFGDDDLLPLMKEMGITEQDVEQFWNDTPGFAIAMIPGATAPLGRLGSAATRRVGAGVRATKKALSDPTLTPKQKVEAVVDGYGVELDGLNAEINRAMQRDAAVPKEVEVVQNRLDEVMPLDETATNLRNLAEESRQAAQKASESGDSSAKTHREVADGYEAAADAVDEMNLEKFEVDKETGKRTIVEKLKPTKGESALNKRMDQMEAQIEAVKQKELSTPPGASIKERRPFMDALRDVANELGRRLDQKFMDEFVHGKERQMAERFLENGVTDPLAYAYLLDDATVKGSNGVASYVFRAETSRYANAKAKFHDSMKQVAEMRGVKPEEVYADVNRMNVIDDMVEAGVADSNMYAMAGASDDLARQKAKEAMSRPERPVVRNKDFGDGVLRPPSKEVKVRGFDQKTTGQIVADTVYGAARVVAGRKPTNILENRLRSITGKT